jgi:hypothetical protein
LDHLIELSHIITPSKLRYNSLLGAREDKAEALYHLIRQHDSIGNEEARKYLFEGKKNKKNLLSRTKNKLNERLINSLLVLQQEDDNSYKNAFIKAHKELAACRILRVEGKRKAFVQIAEKLIKKAIANDLTEIVYALAKELRFQYSSIYPKPKKAQKYGALVRQYHNFLDIEDQIEQLYCQFILLIKKRKDFTPEHIKKAQSWMEVAGKLLEQRKTYWTVLQVSNIRAYYYQMLNDHRQTARACMEALLTFEELPYKVPSNASFSFTFKMIPGQILNQEFEQAARNIEDCLKILRPGQLNWAITKQAEVISLFHQKKYEEVLAITAQIEKYPQNYWSKESWTIYKAYAGILTGQPLRLGKFLNEVPQFAKDARGMNINILIIQIMEYIRKDQYAKVVDRTEALKQYIYRHLRDKDHVRSNCFINMIISLEKGYFKEPTVKIHAAPHYQKLRRNPLKNSKQDFEVVSSCSK